jgi:hypothetical protein
MSPDKQTSSRPLLWIALLVTLGMVYWQWSQGDDSVMPDEITARPATPSRTPVAEPPSRQQASVKVEVPTDTLVKEVSAAERPLYFTRQLPEGKVRHALFAAHEWLPPPPKPQPPPPPQAPPLPYTYVGSMQDVPDGDTVILMQQKKVVLSRLGSQINTQWRLDREDAQAVYFTYLPLNKPVMLSKTKTASASQRQASANTQNNYSEEMFNQ